MSKARKLMTRDHMENHPTDTILSWKTLFLSAWVLTYIAVFKWLSKKQYESNYSDQSQQEQRARWTNQNSLQLTVICLKRGKNRAYKVRLVLVFPLIAWKIYQRILSQSLSVAIACSQDLSLVSWAGAGPSPGVNGEALGTRLVWELVGGAGRKKR